MTKEHVIQTAFSAGELSPHLHDRIDLDAYYSGSASLINFIPLPHGPILRRRGTHFITEAKANAVRLIPFSFNITQTFVLEFSDKCIRVFHESGILLNEEGTVLEIESPYEEKDLPNLNWAQHGDWLYIVDGAHAPHALKRYANTNWAVEQLIFTSMPEEWILDNYPKYVALFEQRAYYAATPSQPQQIWASRTGLYEDFTMFDMVEDNKTILDDHAFTYTIFSNDANGIEWLLAMGSLIIGTAGAEFKMGSTSAIDPVTPKNVRISVQTHYGSASIRPLRIGSSVIFIQRSKNRLRAFEYSFTEDQYTAQDLTIFASHVLEGRAIEMQVQSAPDSYVWIVTETGHLIGCTYEKNQKVLAWHKHETSGKFKSICILPTKGNDQLYAAVERTINGQSKTYIEALIDSWEPADKVENAFYVDSGLVYEGEPIGNLVGLQHLEGEQVYVLVDGWVHPPVTVVNGSIQLQDKGSKISVGLPFTSYFLSLIPQSQQRLTVGQPRRICNAIIAFEDSVDFKYKAQSEEHEEIAYGGPTRIMNKAKPLSSQHKEINIMGSSEKTAQLELWQNRPLPLIIRGIVYTITPNNI